MIHARQFLQPARFRCRDDTFALCPVGFARRDCQVSEKLLGNLLGVTLDCDVDLLGQTNSVGVDVNLDDLGFLRPIVDAVARQRRERI